MSPSLQKLVLIEMHGHPELLQNILDLLSLTEIEVNVLTLSHIVNLLDITTLGRNIKLLPREKKINPREIEISHKDLLDASDLILITTMIADWPGYSALTKKYASACIVHNANFSFHNSQAITTPSFRETKATLRQSIDCLMAVKSTKRKILENCKAIFLLSYPIVQNVNKNTHSAIRVLPYMYRKNINTTIKNSLQITFPGGCSTENKDYSFLIEWLQQLDTLSISKPLSIIFLGNTLSKKSKNLIAKIHSIKPSPIQIISFDHYLSQPKYDQYLCSSDLLISPLRPMVHFSYFDEWYGKTKHSGSINDAIKYQLPILLPEFMNNYQQVHDGLIFYKNQVEFIEVLNRAYLHSEISRKNQIVSDIAKVARELELSFSEILV